MNCEKVQSFLVSYLNKETTPSERVLIQAHLTGCADCQEKLSRISDVEGQISSVLQRRAAQAAPSAAAWDRLDARLAREVASLREPFDRSDTAVRFELQAPQPHGTWLSRLAPGVSRLFTLRASGDGTMKKYFGIAAGVALLVIAIAAFGMFTHVTQVSASSILDRADQARNQALPAQGIQHIRLERYFNVEGLPADQVAGTIEDTYYDLGSCSSRKVTTNSKTGVVLDVHSIDGTSVYGGFTYDLNATGPLMVYRSPIDPASADCLKAQPSGEEMFNQMRSDPNVELTGQQVWTDGRTVYVLRSQPQVNTSKDAQLNFTTSQVTAYFDAQTYQYLGGKVEVTNESGKTWAIKAFRYSVDEILPARTPVHWDVSDLKGIDIIDDPDGSHRDTGARG